MSLSRGRYYLVCRRFSFLSVFCHPVFAWSISIYLIYQEQNIIIAAIITRGFALPYYISPPSHSLLTYTGERDNSTPNTQPLNNVPLHRRGRYLVHQQRRTLEGNTSRPTNYRTQGLWTTACYPAAAPLSNTHSHIHTMLASSLLALLSAATLSAAHSIITYPGWRGDNLITNDTYPYGMQWMYPCKYYYPTFLPGLVRTHPVFSRSRPSSVTSNCPSLSSDYTCPKPHTIRTTFTLDDMSLIPHRRRSQISR